MESGFNPGRHGKRKVNQETQSPLLKIFKDVMLKEASDQEKTSLLSDMPDDKRSKYSTQCNTTLIAIPSRPSVHAQKKDSKKIKGKKSEKKLDQPFSKQYDAFCNKQEKVTEKEKYCCDPKCSADDTFSCHSCAIKKILLSSYKLPCAGKMPGFAIALVVLAILLYLASGCCRDSRYFGLDNLFKSAEPIETAERQDSDKALDERPRGQKGVRNVQVGLVDRLKDVVGYKEELEPRSYSDDTIHSDVSVLDDKYGAVPGAVGGMSYLNNLEEHFRSGNHNELDTILRNSRDFRNSEHLQNFYKKLLQTDAQIQKLKKSQWNLDNRDTGSNRYHDNYYPRHKRSLWKLKRPFGRTHKSRVEKAESREEKKEPREEKGASRTEETGEAADGDKGTVMTTVLPTLLVKALDKGADNRRNVSAVRNLRQITFNVHAEEPSKILIQKKGIIYKFHPSANDRRSKCTHVVTDSKSHEKKLKHPFYKNSQRLDELLDQLLDKNLNNILEPLQGDPFFKHTHAKQGNDWDKDQDKKVASPKTSRLATSAGLLAFSRLFKNPFRKEKKIIKATSTNLPLSFDELMKSGADLKEEVTTSPSTVHTNAVIDEQERDSSQILAPDTPKNPTHSPALIIMPKKHLPSKVLNLRRLLQADEEYDSSIHYTDGREVLNHGHEPHDDEEKGEVTFVKRYAEQEVKNNGLCLRQDISAKPMPDDSSKQLVFTNPNWKGPMPLYLDEIRDMVSAPSSSMDHKGGMKRQLGSGENNEDYNGRDDNGFKLAQAYSDYGALEGRGKENSPATPSTEGIERPEISFKQHNLVLSLHNDEDPETNSKEYTASKEWQKTELKKDESYKIRSLKASAGFKMPGGDDDEDDEEDDEEEESPVKIASFKIIKKREADAPRVELVEKTKNFNDSDNFLAVLSQWFGNMASMSNGSNCLGQKISAELSSGPSPTQTESPSTKSPEYSQVTQIPHDSEWSAPYVLTQDMSYKFRSLLSLDEDKLCNDTENATDGDMKGNGTLLEVTTDDGKAIPETTTTLLTSTSTTIKAILNASTTAKNDKDDNKTVVKRSVPVEKNGLTFWNDLYDDEYGVQVDSLNGPMAATPSDHLDVPRRPENWLRQRYRKLKNLVKNSRSGDRLPFNGLKRRVRDGSALDEHMNDDLDIMPAYPATFSEKVDTSAASETPTTEKSVDFTELTLKMKTVISQAEKAVEETNTDPAPSALRGLPDPGVNNGTEGDVGNTLMRHLMRMMSDVMDYQVHARTCLQLPEDLRVFLVQLTAPDPGRHLRDADVGDDGYLSDDDMFASNSMDLDLSQVREHDPKVDCEKTLKTAEGLMMEYDMLSDDEKRKLPGVKEYLLKQIQFLRSQCSSFTDFSFDLAPYYQDSSTIHRVKRQSNRNDLKKNLHSGKKKKTIGRFLKFWSKGSETTTEIGVLNDENYEYNLSNKDPAKGSNNKLEAAQKAYEMGIQQLKDLNFDVNKQRVDETDTNNVSNDAEDKNLDINDTENENVKNNDPNIKNLKNTVDDSYSVAKAITEDQITIPNKLPKPKEMLDPIFENAILDPAFQNAHKAKLLRFNEAKRLYEKSLKDYEEAKDRFDKATVHYKQRRVEFENSVKQIHVVENVYLTSAGDLRRAYNLFAKPKKRNLYDVYFRAVSEAKKDTVATEKSNYRRITDKTFAK